MILAAPKFLVAPKVLAAFSGTDRLPLLAAGSFELLNDTRALGQATLIAVAAIIVGFIVRRLWPKSMNPVLFGALAGLGLVAGLAAMGVPQAGLVLWAALAVVLVLIVLAFVFN